VFDISDRYVFCTKPPLALTVQFDAQTGLQYEDLPRDTQPLFPFASNSSIRDHYTRREASVRRWQIPGTVAFAITDFKCQGQSQEKLEVDLAFAQRLGGGKSAHQKWTSLNVQLGRLTSSKGLCLREPITLADVAFQPDERLFEFEERLAVQARETASRWAIELECLIEESI
jgi:hypothetical protein